MVVKHTISFIASHTRRKKNILTHNGGEMCESPYNYGVWWIEQCHPKLMTKFFASQNNIEHYYKVKITYVYRLYINWIIFHLWTWTMLLFKVGICCSDFLQS